jgi:hypothetical protein
MILGVVVGERRELVGTKGMIIFEDSELMKS